MSQPAGRPLVLHLAVDYPNVYRPENTPAVRNFVNAADDLDHLVVAMTRSAWPWQVATQSGDGLGDSRVLSMRYWGLPMGVLLLPSMYLAARRVRHWLVQQGVKPTAVHAHKLSFEGISGWCLARWLGVPLLVSVRGEAESKILRFKPTYRPLLQRILDASAHVFFVSAWFKPELNRTFDLSSSKQSLLPNFVTAKPAVPAPSDTGPRLVTVMDLNVYKKKGLDRLLPAFKSCLARWPEARLDVFGRGEPEVLGKVRGLLSQHGLEDAVQLRGAVDNATLLQALPSYAGMVLASHNETFGMIYVEALLAGVPILHSRGTGIDGFVDDIPARVAVDPNSTEAIAEGLCELLASQREHKDWLARHREQVLRRFDRRSYLQSYSAMVYQMSGEGDAGGYIGKYVSAG